MKEIIFFIKLSSNVLLPRELPQKAKNNTIIKWRKILDVTLIFEELFIVCHVIIPTRELKKIKTDEAAAVVLSGIHLSKIDRGVKNIPPPVPVIPDSKPSIEPVKKITIFEGSL